MNLKETRKIEGAWNISLSFFFTSTKKWEEVQKKPFIDQNFQDLFGLLEIKQL